MTTAGNFIPLNALREQPPKLVRIHPGVVRRNKPAEPEPDRSHVDLNPQPLPEPRPEPMAAKKKRSAESILDRLNAGERVCLPGFIDRSGVHYPHICLFVGDDNADLALKMVELFPDGFTPDAVIEHPSTEEPE